MSDNNLTFEITKRDEYYHVRLNGKYLRICANYYELASCIGSIIKGAYKEKKEEYSYR